MKRFENQLPEINFNMKTRQVSFLLLSPVLALAMATATFTATGCGGTRSEIGGGGGDGGGGTTEVDASSDLDSSVIPGKNLTDAGPGVLEQHEMIVDGITCTGVTEKITSQTAPDGHTWTVDIAGTCGSLGLVSVLVVSKDDLAYPQSCSASSSVRLSVGSEAGDAELLAYATDVAGGGCEILSGPEGAKSSSPQLTAIVSSASGKIHSLRYQVPGGL